MSPLMTMSAMWEVVLSIRVFICTPVQMPILDTGPASVISICRWAIMDNTTSHIADMVIKGDTMGITKMTRELNQSVVEDPRGFTSVDELIQIKGIGEKKLEELRDYVYVEVWYQKVGVQHDSHPVGPPPSPPCHRLPLPFPHKWTKGPALEQGQRGAFAGRRSLHFGDR